ncbi:MAG: hypothetical protein IJD79_03580 [Clostridia bacterium]|nr:hypothetical protein [Clostridia bacterium]
MKRLLSLILILCTLLSLAACSDKTYEPVPSTDEEKKVLMTFSLEGEKYELRYELYRALFLNHSAEYDKGDKSFWATPEAEDAKQKINARVTSLALDIFAALHLSKEIGYDPYSADAEKKIEEYIKESVEGSDTVIGFGGDYDKYLASLKAMNLNYSVQTLMLRYSIACEKINEYYRGTADPDAPTPDMEAGALKYTKDDVLAFYRGDDSARISIVVFNADYISHEKVEERRDKLDSFASLGDALNYAASFTPGDPEDVINGALIGKKSSSSFYTEVTDAAFEMGVGDVSPVIHVVTDKSSEYWIVIKMDKTEEYAEENYEAVEDIYVSQRINEIIDGVKTSLADNKSEKDAFTSLDLSKISMD